MNVAIVGSREFSDLKMVEEIVYQLSKSPEKIAIVSGGARGVDETASITACKYNMMVMVHYPDWKKHGKSAGFIRNELIINDADKVIAFWDGQSKGTKHSIDLAIKAGKPVDIYIRK